MHSSDARKSKQLARQLKKDSDTITLYVSAILSTVLGPDIPLNNVLEKFTEVSQLLIHMQSIMSEQLPTIGEKEE